MLKSSRLFLFSFIFIVLTFSFISADLYSEPDVYGPSPTETEITITQASILSVNSSDWWDSMDAINTTQMENSGGILNILVSWLEGLIEGSFNSRQELCK